MNTILALHAREILDSRGYPTIEVDVILDNGIHGRASVPSGASTGKYEAIEQRDKENSRFNGKGVRNAVALINGEIFDALSGLEVYQQGRIDQVLIDLDGTSNKERLGANAILGVSLAVAKAAAKGIGLPLYRYLGGIFAHQLPVPLINILNGGMHADTGLDIQEFMIIPVSGRTIRDAIRIGAEIFHALKSHLKQGGYATNLGDEGGFAPALSSVRQALDIIMQAIEKSGYKPEGDVLLALDAAATVFYHDNHYYLKGEGLILDADQLIDYWIELTKTYPIVSLEDGMAEDDWAGWHSLTKAIGDHIQLVGDDLFVTNPTRLADGITHDIANAILIKPNQIGTLTETLQTIDIAHRAGYRTILSHRSGETEDTTIADLAVATNCGQIKTGSLARSERVAKYNQLIRIEEQLGKEAQFLGYKVLSKREVQSHSR